MSFDSYRSTMEEAFVVDFTIRNIIQVSHSLYVLSKCNQWSVIENLCKGVRHIDHRENPPFKDLDYQSMANF